MIFLWHKAAKENAMKKVFLFALAVLLLLPLTAFADYATYFDVIGDVKQLLGDDPDAAWEMSRDSAAGAAGPQTKSGAASA